MFGSPRAALLFAAMVAATGTACTGDIDNTQAGDDGPDAGVDLGPGDHEAVARAKEWVDAMVPYCQAPNHAKDYDTACSSTCTRPDVPEWDPYRSDCSGLVSWAWGLPAPGRTTATLAPYNTQVSHTIDATELLPGDAINNDHHTMVFVQWLDDAKSKARFYEEPGCSSTQPYARQYDATIMMMSGIMIVTNRGTYTAIRQTK